MIKLGIMARARPDSDLEKQIRFARALNLDMIDFHLGGFPRDPESMLRIKKLCLELGMPIGYLGSGGGYVGTGDELQQRMEKDKADIDVAVFMGAPLVRLMGGRPRPDDPTPESTWTNTIRCFQEVADYAADRGIALGVQNHPPPVAPRGEDILRILNETDRVNVTHIMDTGQWWGSIEAHPRGEFDPEVDIYEYMKQTAPFASCVRAKIYKIDTGREEWLDHARVLSILRAMDYNGEICICFEGQGNKFSYEDCMRMAVGHLRELLANG